MRRPLTLILIAVLLLVITGCTKTRPRYVIGVSQCSEDIWRTWQNQELSLEANLCREADVELCFAAARDNSERQIQQIDSLVASGIQLLIVAPNQKASVSSAIDRAYDKGIPVIVFERNASTKKYTAFVSADNYEMGCQMGQYIATRLQGRGHVIEILGLKDSSPADDRHDGFRDALKEAPGIQVVATLQGDWTEESAFEATRKWLAANPHTHVDYVFGHSDRMAMGARKAVEESSYLTLHSSLPKFCGIDGLTGQNGGIRQVRDSLLEASYIYPTRGDLLFDLALDILSGKPFQRETMLTSAIVTRDNAEVLLLEGEEVERRSQKLEALQETADGLLQQLDSQRLATMLAFGIAALLLIVFVLFYLYHLSRINLQHERIINNLWNLKPETVAAAPVAPAGNGNEEEDAEPDPLFLTQFKDVVDQRLGDSQLNVEELASAMNLSRVQLYRKVKAITDSTPVELLRMARLQRAYQLLMTTGKSVSEIAYQVGFTAPSYFTKCFKDTYGIPPVDVRRQ